jgi:hypothetical protein
MGRADTSPTFDPVLDEDEDLQVARAYNFRIHDRRHTLYKEKGEPYRHLLLRAAAIYLYAPIYETLTADTPRVRNKFKPDIAAFNYADEPLFWAECGDTPADKLEFALKHAGANEVAYLDTLPLTEMEATARKKVHYKYLDKLVLIHVPPDTLTYMDPDHVWIDERDLDRHFF